jgi:hypothetical protein
MQKLMSKTSDTSRSATPEDHRPLADCELDAASGGFFGDIVKQLMNQPTTFGGPTIIIGSGGVGGNVDPTGGPCPDVE